VKNVVADFLSRLPTKQVQIKEEEEVLDTNDNNYEINLIASKVLSIPICPFLSWYCSTTACLICEGIYNLTIGSPFTSGFIDLYSGWPEAFSVPAKTTDNVAHLLIEEIIPRHSGIQILTSDNGGENCTYVTKGVGWNRRLLHGSPNLC
jgi:hypothetical protein